MDKARHNANFAGAGFDDARAIWTNEPCLGLRLEHGLDTDHVQLRNTYNRLKPIVAQIGTVYALCWEGALEVCVPRPIVTQKPWDPGRHGLGIGIA